MAVTAATSKYQFPSQLAIVGPAAWVVLVLVAIVLALYWASFAWLGTEWSSSSGVFSHGYLVAALCLYLLLHSMPKLSAQPIQPFWRALPVVIALSFVWLLGYLADVVIVHTSVLPLLVVAAVLLALGRAAALAIAFAVLYLYFAMPVWGHLQFVLQAITISVVHFLIHLVDVPVFVEGNFVFLPAGTFEIAGGCSGLSFLLAGISLAALYGHLFYKSVRDRWLLAVVVFVVSMAINWIRVSVIVFVGNASQMHSPLVEDHLAFGWILFAIAMVPLFFLARRLEPSETAPANVSVDEMDNVAMSPVWLSSAVAIMALATGPLWAHAVRSVDAQTASAAIYFPEMIGPWSGPMFSPAVWKPKFAGPTAEKIAKYVSENGSVWIYANVYVTQEQDRELIYYKNSIAGDWRIRATSLRVLDLPGVDLNEVREIIADGHQGRWLIWYWYVINGRVETSDMRAKLLHALASLLGSPSSGVTSMAVQCNEECRINAREIESLMMQMGPALRSGNFLVQRKSE